MTNTTKTSDAPLAGTVGTSGTAEIPQSTQCNDTTKPTGGATFIKKLLNIVTRPKPYTLPMITLNGFLNTVEGCTLYANSREIYGAVSHTYSGFSDEVKHALTFSPNCGEYIDRALFWKRELSGKLTDKDRYTAMRIILRWYRHCSLLKPGEGSA